MAYAERSLHGERVVLPGTSRRLFLGSWRTRLVLGIFASPLLLVRLSPPASFAQPPSVDVVESGKADASANRAVSTLQADAGPSRDLNHGTETDGGIDASPRKDSASSAADTQTPSPPTTPSATPSPPVSQDEVHASAVTPTSSFDPYRYVGLSVDIGNSGPLPDAGLLLIGKPVKWAYLHAGPTTNFLAFGVRGGLTLVNPLFVPLSLTCEVGHFYEGDANTAKRWFTNDAQDIAALHNFSYDYVNLLGGLAFESRHVVVFIRGGTTWMRARVRNFQQTVYDASKVEIQSTDPKVSYRGPSLRLGLVFFL